MVDSRHLGVRLRRWRMFCRPAQDELHLAGEASGHDSGRHCHWRPPHGPREGRPPDLRAHHAPGGRPGMEHLWKRQHTMICLIAI